MPRFLASSLRRKLCLQAAWRPRAPPPLRSSMDAAKPAGPPPPINTLAFEFIPIPQSFRYATGFGLGYYTPARATVLGGGACFASTEDAENETADAPATAILGAGTRATAIQDS